MITSLSAPVYQDLYYGLKPSAWARQGRIVWDPWQLSILDDKSQFIHAVTSRQIGKSTVISAKAAHRAWYRYKQLILILAPTLRQSNEMILKVKNFFEDQGFNQEHLKIKSLSIHVTHTDSRIIALPGNNPDSIRGFSAPNMVVVDEAAFAKDKLFFTLMPMLAMSNGQLLCISSAGITKGFFYDTHQKKPKSWSFYNVPATACPRMSSKYLAEQRGLMGDWWFNAEYMAVFQAPQNAVFTQELITHASRGGFKPLFDEQKIEPTITGSHRPLFEEQA